MEYIICYKSALEYWRSKDHLSLGTYPARRSATDYAQSLLRKDSKTFLMGRSQIPSACSRPVHILVATQKAGTRASEVVSYFWKEPLPECSVEEAGEGVFVSTPEFCFLQMASKLSLVQLIVLGFELCGTYRLQRNKPAARRESPLTSVEKLKRFIEKTSGPQGKALAVQALRYILNGSASPMETALTILLCLPPRLGGYGIKPPQLNVKIEIPERSRPFADRIYCEGDLCWSEEGVCLEYDSKLYHLEPGRQHSDAVRRNTLTSLGYTVVTVSSRQVYDKEMFARLARQVARLTGRQLRLSNHEFTQKHCELRKEILSRMDNGGEISAQFDIIPVWQKEKNKGVYEGC